MEVHYRDIPSNAEEHVKNITEEINKYFKDSFIHEQVTKHAPHYRFMIAPFKPHNRLILHQTVPNLINYAIPNTHFTLHPVEHWDADDPRFQRQADLLKNHLYREISMKALENFFRNRPINPVLHKELQKFVEHHYKDREKNDVYFLHYGNHPLGATLPYTQTHLPFNKVYEPLIRQTVFNNHLDEHDSNFPNDVFSNIDKYVPKQRQPEIWQALTDNYLTHAFETNEIDPKETHPDFQHMVNHVLKHPVADWLFEKDFFDPETHKINRFAVSNRNHLNYIHTQLLK